MFLLWRVSSKGETRATRGSDLTLQLKCRLSFFFASDYTLSGAKASTTSVTCISNSRNTPSFSNRLSNLVNCLREAEMRGRERGPACSPGQQRVSVFGSARQAVTRRGFHSSKNQRCAAAGKYIRCKRVDWGCGVKFQEKEVEDTSAPDQSVLIFYSFVSLWFNDGYGSQQVKIESKKCFQPM